MIPPIKHCLGHRSSVLVSTLYTIGLTVAFLLPVSDVPSLDIPLLDKWVHVLFHTVLAALWLISAYLADKSHFSSKVLALVLVICFFYGVAIEAVQHWFTATRTFDTDDILANGIGELAGLVAFKAVKKKL